MSLLLLRRLLAPPRPSPSSCQLRHASKKASKNSSNVTVQLLQDIPRFGRAGTSPPPLPPLLSLLPCFYLLTTNTNTL